MPKLLRELKAFYKISARAHLPWRQTRDPYRILVSEVMLQQTQVERVIPFYKRFIEHFPSPQALARAPLKNVLKAWSGLGYNRRAHYLQRAAQEVGQNGFPHTAEEIEALPGVGPYTSRAVAAFAYNAPEVFVETNIRTVFIHYCFKRSRAALVPDCELLPLIAQALKRSGMQPRDFYAALMDYGAHLKKQGVRLNARSAHYAKQKKFAGSPRQLRGMVLRALLAKPLSVEALTEAVERKKSDVVRAVAGLSREGLVEFKRHKVHIAK